MKSQPNLKENSSSIMKSLFDGVSDFYKDTVVKTSEDVDGEKNMNRMMLRQVVERKDVSKFLDKKSKEWVLGRFTTTISLLVMAVTFVLLFKKIVLAICVIWVMLSALFLTNIFKKVNLQKDFEELLKKIAGSDAHYHVLTEMLRNTPYPMVSKNKDSGWVYREMRNFKEKDAEFLIQEDIQSNENSIKTDLLRNINK